MNVQSSPFAAAQGCGCGHTVGAAPERAAGRLPIAPAARCATEREEPLELQEPDGTPHVVAPGHPIHTFVTEHVAIVGVLDALDAAARALGAATDGTAARLALAAIEAESKRLIDAEPHHQREERVLFPELSARGLEGPPRVMLLEHQELRRRKHAVLDLARELAAQPSPPEPLRARLQGLVAGLSGMLREHIWKEDHLLYPMALATIARAETWTRLKAACDEIGYCCHHPA